MNRRHLLAAAGTLAAAPLHAQPTWPDRPLRIVVPFAPGSAPDILARLLEPGLRAALGQPVVVENRAGGGGNIGAAAVAQATDRHAILVSSSGPAALNKYLFDGLAFDPERDLQPVSLTVNAPQLLVVANEVRARDVAGLVAEARGGAPLFYATTGAGTPSHLTMEDFRARAGLRMEMVTYRGFAQAILDMVAGRIHAMFALAPAVLPAVRDGRIRALAVASRARFAMLPDLPTMAEAGVPDFEALAWIGFFAPANLEAPSVARLNAAIRDAARQPAVREALERQAYTIDVEDGPDAVRAALARDVARWVAVIRAHGIRGEA
jgi:tripartite-type tricarboxylate transporter receptor subunit TctC